MLRAELRALVDAGATIIQVDEPSPAIHPDARRRLRRLLNAAIEPVVGRVRLGAHLCFGNYLGRPLARRTYRPDPRARCSASGSMSSSSSSRIASSPRSRSRPRSPPPGETWRSASIDVKNSYVETADDVAERIDRVLATGVPPERLTLVPDCGFSQTARGLTVPKLRAMVAGRDLVLGRRSQG